MSIVNPVIDLHEQRRIAIAKRKIQYPIKIYCIVDDLSDASRDTLVRQIKEHALQSKVIFSTRVYDSQKYSNDRDIITRLPAFHVHIKNVYNRTFYANTRPLDHINECIALYLKDEKEKVQRKAEWLKFFERCKNFLYRLVHKETAMERYERETYATAKKSRFENMKLNVSEWG
jgi:hypothetical protein